MYNGVPHLQHWVARVLQIVGTQVQLVQFVQFLDQEGDGGPGHVIAVENKLQEKMYWGCHDTADWSVMRGHWTLLW